MRWVVAVLAISGLFWLAYQGYKDQRFQELINTRSVSRPPLPKQEEPFETVRPVRRSNRRGREGTEGARASQEGEMKAAPAGGSVESSASGQELARTLLGIMAARNLASGISLGVDKDRLSVHGEVDNAEKKRQIVQILENARGNRKLDMSELLVRPSQ